MHSALFKGALAIVFVTGAVAAHSASVTVQQGTNTITSEQDGDAATGTLKIEKLPGRTVLHQKNGGNSVDFAVGGKGNSVVTTAPGPTHDDETPETPAADQDDR